MSWGILLLAAVLIAAAQRFWAPFALTRLRFRGSCDRLLVEPDQTVVWSGTVENRARLPIPFVRLRESLPEEARILEDTGWKDKHCRKGLRKWYIEERLSLGPRQSSTRTVRLQFSRRGVYSLDGVTLSAGDLLGFQEAQKFETGGTVVVMPRLTRVRRSLDALGGFLGDISVRRFIAEDPILTVGFRDYTGHEPMKSISWIRSAAAGQLQVRQYDHTAQRNVVILLNLEGARDETLEECLRLMRTACQLLERKKIPYGLRTNGDLPGPVGKLFSMPEGLGSRHLNTILFALGQATGTCYCSFRLLARQTLLHRKSNESYIVITTAPDGATRSVIRTLEAACGNPVCLLTAEAGEGTP